MHLLRRESFSLDEQAQAEDLEHTPTDIVFLSFTDSDLSALSVSYRGEEQAVSLQVVSLARLRHPLSVDLYLEKTIAHARCVIIRLLGGLDYWRYGVEECSALCKRNNIALAIISGDGHQDKRLVPYSHIPAPWLAAFEGYFSQGGMENYRLALKLATHISREGVSAPYSPPLPIALPMCGYYPFSLQEETLCPHPHQKTAFILFYRAHLLAHDIKPLEILAEALRQKNIIPYLIYVSSLKDKSVQTFIEDQITRLRPDIILNATFFSARDDHTGASILEKANCPIVQVFMPLSSEKIWRSSFRGLSQSDMAMQMVLPELDGRLAGTAISFKEEHNGLTFNAPFEEGIHHIVDLTTCWLRLKKTPRPHRKLALILSDYPGVGGQIGHAVGLDSFASVHHILNRLDHEGYQLATIPSLTELTQQLTQAPLTPALCVEDYKKTFATFPPLIQEQLLTHWGEPEQEASKGYFAFRFTQCGHVITAIQPERANAKDHKTLYHDADAPPCHSYIAFYIWLRKTIDVHALIHMGTHGTLEWLPGKAAALSAQCYPHLLLHGLPVLYPFIVNNPGEAACAKRRLGAVTIGHLTPPVKTAHHHGPALELERLIDAYAEADGLDNRRMEILKADILDKAETTGLLAESGANRQEMTDDTALARLDAYLCDVKDLQIREGLHIFGAPSAHTKSLIEAISRFSPQNREQIADHLQHSSEAEMNALLSGLDGYFVPPGPAGAPTRGRMDVLPTGRNLYTVDPRAIPTHTAFILAQKTAQAILTRYMHEEGDYLRRTVIDIWASSTLRTGGEDLALAFILMGIEPVYDTLSSRLTGFDIIPIAQLDRPRVDVTLRISGLFRDNFENQIALFDQAVQAIAAQDESPEWNPLVTPSHDSSSSKGKNILTRIYSSAPHQYGAGFEKDISAGQWVEKTTLGQKWLDHSAYAYTQSPIPQKDPEGLIQRMAHAQLLLHSQDHAETDLLETPDYAAHEGGMLAAAHALGNKAVFYHADTSVPENPRIRLLVEEVRRIVRGRAANHDWLKAMKAHSYRGAAEIARTLESLFSFAATLPDQLDQQFSLVYDATLGNEEISTFIQQANPAAENAMKTRFKEAIDRGLWHPKRNSIIQSLTSSTPSDTDNIL